MSSCFLMLSYLGPCLPREMAPPRVGQFLEIRNNWLRRMFFQMQTNQFRASLGHYPEALITPRPDAGQLGTRPVPGAYRSHSHWKSEVCPPASPPPSCRNHRRGCHSQPPLALLPPDPPDASIGGRGGGPAWCGRPFLLGTGICWPYH